MRDAFVADLGRAVLTGLVIGGGYVIVLVVGRGRLSIAGRLARGRHYFVWRFVVPALLPATIAAAAIQDLWIRPKPIVWWFHGPTWILGGALSAAVVGWMLGSLLWHAWPGSTKTNPGGGRTPTFRGRYPGVKQRVARPRTQLRVLLAIAVLLMIAARVVWVDHGLIVGALYAAVFFVAGAVMLGFDWRRRKQGRVNPLLRPAATLFLLEGLRSVIQSVQPESMLLATIDIALGGVLIWIVLAFWMKYRQVSQIMCILILAGAALTRCGAPAGEEPSPTLPPCSEASLAKAPCETPYDIAPTLANPGEISQALARFYPNELRDAGVGGRAVVWLLVDPRGEVQNVQLKEGAEHPALNHAAMEAAKRMRFQPARSAGNAVSVWVAMPLTFDVGGQ